MDIRPLSYYGLLLLQEKFFCSPMVDWTLSGTAIAQVLRKGISVDLTLVNCNWTLYLWLTTYAIVFFFKNVTKKVTLSRAQRNKKKYVTVVTGLGTFGRCRLFWFS